MKLHKIVGIVLFTAIILQAGGVSVHPSISAGLGRRYLSEQKGWRFEIRTGPSFRLWFGDVGSWSSAGILVAPAAGYQYNRLPNGKEHLFSGGATVMFFEESDEWHIGLGFDMLSNSLDEVDPGYRAYCKFSFMGLGFWELGYQNYHSKEFQLSFSVDVPQFLSTDW